MSSPPPKRTVQPGPASTPDKSTSWRDKVKQKGSAWGKVAMNKTVVVSDNLGGKVNHIAEKRFGTEAFWPTTGDFGKEMNKAARILRAFTVDGVVVDTLKDGSARSQPKGVVRQIPPEIIASAKGLAIFTSMRSGIAPLGGAGGAGIVVAKLPSGEWSAPSSISPNNLSTGFLIGLDVYDCVLVIRSQAALDSFKTHKATLGTELAIAAGPFGGGAAVEIGIDKAPLFSYVRSRGLYAGVEIIGQVFVERFDENAAMYAWPGIKAGDILQGKVRMPVEAEELHQALKGAETGRSRPVQNEMVVLLEGEVMSLPPTPDDMEADGRLDTFAERKRVPLSPGLPKRPEQRTID